MHEQDRVSEFVTEHDLDAPPEYRILDLVSELGEVAKDACESTDYGATDAVFVNSDELGDALFSLLALCDDLDVDAADALDEALEKYERRLSESGSPDSGSHT